MYVFCVTPDHRWWDSREHQVILLGKEREGTGANLMTSLRTSFTFNILPTSVCINTTTAAVEYHESCVFKVLL
jgi:hypothetical protein